LRDDTIGKRDRIIVPNCRAIDEPLAIRDRDARGRVEIGAVTQPVLGRCHT
jgi:hypothetical protein